MGMGMSGSNRTPFGSFPRCLLWSAPFSLSHSMHCCVHLPHDSGPKAGTNVWTVMHVLFSELFGNPPCTHFMEVMSVMDDLVGRAVSDLQKFCYCFAVLLSRINAQTCSVFPSFIEHSASVTFVWAFWNILIHSYTVFCSKTVTNCVLK
jgi:hypothetical protein